MVLDTSALVAVLLAEPERDGFVSAIAAAPLRLLSAANALELSIVLLAKKGPAGLREMEAFLAAAKVEVVAFEEEQLAVARDAYRRFGRGRHPAALNFGDACAYALSKQSGEPLLFKGRDFSQTDVECVVVA